MKFIAFASIAHSDTHKRIELDSFDRASAIAEVYRQVPYASRVSCRPLDPSEPRYDDRRLTGAMPLGA